MLIRDLLEAPSLDSTINAVATDIGTNVQSLYRQLEITLSRMIEKNGTSDGFPFVKGSLAKRWMDTYYDNLNRELYDLSRQAGKNGVGLQRWLSNRDKDFQSISNSLPDILKDLAGKLGSTHLKNSAEIWNKANIKLNATYNENNIKDDSDNIPTPTTPTVKKQSTTPQQNVQAEKIVNDILNSLPSGVAGEIRNAISRSSNKLQDLQKELNRRGISINR